jgi:hypothetical protein
MADDDFGMGGIEDRDGYAVATAAGELSVIEGGAKVLKAVSAIAAALWILAVVFMFWNWYDIAEKTTGSINFTISAGSGPNSSVLQALATTLGSTWGYLLVAVLAYTGAMLLHGQRMRLLIAAMSDDD